MNDIIDGGGGLRSHPSLYVCIILAIHIEKKGIGTRCAWKDEMRERKEGRRISLG